MTQLIPLTRGAVARVDDADYARLVAVGSWSLSHKGYAVHWYTDPTTGKQHALYMHRFIMTAPPHLHVDHINHNRLDNQRNNLRFATHSQDNANRRTLRTNTSGYTGVNRNRGHWEARIRYQRQRIYLGSFADPERAALAYDAAARLLFAEFARPNFPERPTPPELEEAIIARLARREIAFERR